MPRTKATRSATRRRRTRSTTARTRWAAPGTAIAASATKTGPSDVRAGQWSPGSRERLVEPTVHDRFSPDRQRPRPGHHGLRVVPRLELGVAGLVLERLARQRLRARSHRVPRCDAGREVQHQARHVAVRRNGPSNPALPLQNAGLTPLQGTLITAHDYFAGTLADPKQGGPLAAPPNSCGKNFTVAVTNGLPSVKADGTPSSDVVTMLADVAAAATSLQTLSVDTYIVGFALPFGVNPSQLDTIAAAGGTSTAYSASDQATLIDALDQIFADILRRSGAASAVALNSSSLAANNWLYQAKFDIGWAGRLLAYPINPGDRRARRDSRPGTPSTVLDTMNWDTGRSIITYKPSTRGGIPFRWPVDPTHADGDRARRRANDGAQHQSRRLRRHARRRPARLSCAATTASRATTRRRNSGRVTRISATSSTRDPSTSPSRATTIAIRAIAAFRLEPGDASRTPVIYVGGNDGYLHGFRASDGREVLAYMPSAVYANLSKLTGQGYAHRYYVDGSPNVADAKIGAGSTWRTMLVSGLGAGGRGVFALDVTDPSTFSEANAASNRDVGVHLRRRRRSRLHVRPAVDRQAQQRRLGRDLRQRLQQHGFGSSPESSSSICQTGAVISKLMTGVGSAGTPNGIGSVVAVDTDGDDTADIVYAGDLRADSGSSTSRTATRQLERRVRRHRRCSTPVPAASISRSRLRRRSRCIRTAATCSISRRVNTST